MSDEHNRLRRELAAYALGALEPADEARLAAHLRDCTACRLLLAEYWQALERLPQRPEVLAPSPATRATLLARARSEASAPLAPPRRLPRRQLLGWGAVAASLTGLLGWNVALQRQLEAGPAPSIEALAHLPEGRIVALIGSGAPGASARLYVADDGRHGQLAVAGLPPLPPDRVYQLWFAQPGEPTRTGGAFRVDGGGTALAPMTLPAPLERVRAVAVTAEPAPFSPGPTGPHLLDGQL